MKRFDFISGAPKTFIFQKNTNKTNLGGIFTIFFIVMIFLIIFSYLYEYFANDKYKVSYIYDEIFYGFNPMVLIRFIMIKNFIQKLNSFYPQWKKILKKALKYLL